MLNRQSAWTCSKVLSHRMWNSAGGSEAAQAPREKQPGGGRTTTQPASQPHIPLHSRGATGILATRPVLPRCIVCCNAKCGSASRTQRTSWTEANFGFVLLPQLAAPSTYLLRFRVNASSPRRPKEARWPQIALPSLGTGKTR